MRTQWTQLTLIGLALSGPGLSQNAAEWAPPTLEDESFASWRDRIQIGESERSWEQLPWYVTYHQGLQQAGVEGKPLLLWVMNGHPLGCT